MDFLLPGELFHLSSHLPLPGQPRPGDLDWKVGGIDWAIRGLRHLPDNLLREALLACVEQPISTVGLIFFYDFQERNVHPYHWLAPLPTLHWDARTPVARDESGHRETP